MAERLGDCVSGCDSVVRTITSTTPTPGAAGGSADAEKRSAVRAVGSRTRETTAATGLPERVPA